MFDGTINKSLKSRNVQHLKSILWPARLSESALKQKMESCVVQDIFTEPRDS